MINFAKVSHALQPSLSQNCSASVSALGGSCESSGDRTDVYASSFESPNTLFTGHYALGDVKTL